MSSYYTRLDRFPPILCRLLARGKRYGGPMTTQNIATTSGLSLIEVEALSQQTTWEGVEVHKVRAFTRACKIDFDDAAQMRRIEDYMGKSPSFRYLRASPDWKTYYLPMLTRWRKSYGIVSNDSKLWPPIKKLLIRLNPLIK